MSKFLFVYGTLREGERGHHNLKGATRIGEARLPGYDLIDIGPFPGIKENEENKVGILGELYKLPDYPILALLDFYEGYTPGDGGSLFIRKEVLLGEQPVYVYVYNGPAGGFLIRSGDFCEKKVPA